MKKGYTLVDVLITFALIGAILCLTFHTLFGAKSRDERWCVKYGDALGIHTEYIKEVGCIKTNSIGEKEIITKEGTYFNQIQKQLQNSQSTITINGHALSKSSSEGWED